MKTLKKALSVILGLAIMLSCVMGMQVSVAAEGTLAVSVGEATVADGVVTVPVNIDSNPGFQTLAIEVIYEDTVLSLVNSAKNADFVTVADPGNDVPGEVGAISPDYKEINWAYVTSDDVTATGTIATLTFNVVDASATETEVSVVVTEAEDVAGTNLAATATVEACTVVFVKECTHEWGTGVVTTQPTKDVEGVRTYTCSLCNETKTEAIAIPTATTAVTLKPEIIISSVVGNSITLSTKQMRTAYGESATYFIVIDYQKYATGYVLEDKTVTLTPADRDEVNSTANKDLINFQDIAIYEMTLDFTMTAYFVDGNGVVVGYREVITNIADMALTLANSNTSNTKLLTALADMCVYGDEAQKYFSKANPGTPICDAVLPSTILGETFMAYKSSADDLPAAGSYNNDKGSTKIVSTTGFVSGGQSLVIGASNQIEYTIRYDNYNWEDVTIEVSYDDSVYGQKTIVLDQNDLIANGTAGNGQPKFKYYFKDVGLYDCDKTVTMNMYYKGNLELTSVYSFGNYVNSYLNTAGFTEILTAMELFSNSVGVQLNLPARW